MGIILCMVYIRLNTRVYINSYRDVVPEGCDGTVAVKKQECRDTRGKTDRTGCRRYDVY